MPDLHSPEWMPRLDAGGLPVTAPLQDPGQLCEVIGVPFSDEQLAAITAPLAPGVIIAGAGSGKTTVMAARVVWLVGTGAVRTDQVLGLTFTRKAAGELSARISAALVRSGVVDESTMHDMQGQVVMTYDAFAGRLVAEHAPRIGEDPIERLLSEPMRYRLAGLVVSEAEGDWEHIQELSPAGLVDQLVTLDAEMSSHLVDPEQLEAFTSSFLTGMAQAPLHRGRPYHDVAAAIDVAQARLELLELVRAYRARKKQLAAGDFGDRMALATRIARSAPQAADELRRQFRAVLLDEYQDTSAAQTMMLAGLFSGPDAEHGLGHPVMAVGDPRQGIYGWRGAAANTINEFARTFRRGDGSPAEVFALTVNRRSGPAILRCANEVAARMDEDPALPAPARTRSRLRAPAGTAPGSVTVGRFDDVNEEMAWLAADVAAHGGPGRWADIAVLSRTNAAVGRIYDELAEADVPVEIVGLGGLVSLSPVREIVATLRLLDDETNNPALVELLTSRRWRMGASDLASLAAAARRAAAEQETGPEPGPGGPAADDGADGMAALVDGLTRPPLCLLDVLDRDIPGISGQGARRLRRFADEFARARRGLGEPLAELVRRICLLAGVDAELEGDPAFFRQGRREQVRRFLDVVTEFSDTDPGAGLSAFLAHLDLQIDHENGMEQAIVSPSDSVKLLTIHRAKGLEWGRVYLPWLVDGVFPDHRADNWVNSARLLPGPLRGDSDSLPALREYSRDGIGAHAEELRSAAASAEDRLAYVAITRARHDLVATSHVWEPGRSRPRAASPYYDILAAGAQQVVAEPVADAGENPLGEVRRRLSWPSNGDEPAQQRLDALAAFVLGRRTPTGEAEGFDSDEPLDLDEQATVDRWTREAELLLAQEARHQDGGTAIAVPGSLSATALIQSQRDRAEFMATLARPMPRRASTSAGVGTSFHEWVEARFRRAGSPLIDDRMLEPGGGDELTDDGRFGAHAARGDERALARLQRLKECFEAGPYAERTPCAVEEAFVLMLDGQQIRGRIDAVFALDDDPDHDFRVVDWKTYDGPGDALQLALYRLAWSDIAGVPPDRVDAVFHHVMSGTDERPDRLTGRDGLREMVAGLRAEDPGRAGPDPGRPLGGRSGTR
ncbi:ATP-dependent helicase [Propionibacterium australiense]|nr:ATP-dependent helicase [Propionibacterium australiense]